MAKTFAVATIVFIICLGCHRSKTPAIIPPFPGQITTVAGNGTVNVPFVNGSLALKSSIAPVYIAIDISGNIYFTDGEIFKINTTGILNKIAGNGTAGYSGDGGPASEAQVESGSLCLDKNGNIYFVDQSNIRKINTAGIIGTIAGTGSPGYNGDGIPATAAAFNAPAGVATDNSGNVYVADAGNYRIRKIDTAGIITTVAGNGTQGYTGIGGPATAAEIDVYFGIAVDALGNIYFDNEQTISKVNSMGMISNFAGNHIAGFSGDGGPATNAEIQIGGMPGYGPGNWQIAVDGAGNIYITDGGNERIRKIDNSGIITTIAGNGYKLLVPRGGYYYGGYSGDGGPATAAELNWPMGVAINSDGDIYISDTYNYRIRKVSK